MCQHNSSAFSNDQNETQRNKMYYFRPGSTLQNKRSKAQIPDGSDGYPEELNSRVEKRQKEKANKKTMYYIWVDFKHMYTLYFTPSSSSSSSSHHQLYTHTASSS